MVNEKDKEIEKLKKDLKFANMQLAKTLKLYDSAKKETKKAVESRSEFMSKLSHEAKTPMNALLGYSDLINQIDLKGEFFDYTMGIKSATNRLLSFFNDIIELSRIESGLATLIEDDYTIIDSIKTVMSTVRYEIESKGLELRFSISDTVPTAVCGDRTHIHQIILNLINNAIKFTDKGYISINVDAKDTGKVSEEGEKIVELIMSVEDTGKGIKQDDKEKLFKAFTQFNTNSPYANQGAGLGLIISKYFSNLMGGDITFESEYGKGSTFTCTFMQRVVDATLLDSKYVEDYIYNSDMKLSAPEARVLLVDDSRVNLSVASGFLKWFDIDADVAAGGMEAITMAKAKAYDIIFMDHMMPDIDGIDATKLIRQQNEHNKNLPIIALTANTTDEARIMFRENGLNDFLAKPVEIDSFKAMLERWLPRERIVRASKNGKKSGNEISYEGINTDKFMDNGIDVEKGCVYFAGKIAAYIDTLALVYKEGCTNIEKLKGYYADMDMKNYGILAHSIKSVMASIGAGELSNLAKEHEMMAKDENSIYIAKNGKNFIEKYSVIIEFIGQNVNMDTEKKEAANTDKTSENRAGMEEIKRIISEAIADIEDFESDAAVDKLNKLKESL